MVVVCGTATTIDFLSRDGVFKGGMIMPGVGLMLRSLHEGTAALPDQGGEFFDYPTQTVDAIASGCQHAQAGAIERLYAHESRDRDDRTSCLLSGGAARAVAPRLRSRSSSTRTWCSRASTGCRWRCKSYTRARTERSPRVVTACRSCPLYWALLRRSRP